MGLGLVDSCIELIQRSNRRLGHVNQFLDDQAEDLAMDLQVARDRTYALAISWMLCRGSSVEDMALIREVISSPHCRF